MTPTAVNGYSMTRVDKFYARSKVTFHSLQALEILQPNCQLSYFYSLIDAKMEA